MRSGNEKWELEVGMRSGERMRMDVGRESRQKDWTREADKQRAEKHDCGPEEREGDWGGRAGWRSGEGEPGVGMRINPI